MALEDDGGATRAKLLELEKRYAGVPKKGLPHPDLGCWWTVYDYGLERVKGWAPDYKHPYPGGGAGRACVCVWWWRGQCGAGWCAGSVGRSGAGGFVSGWQVLSWGWFQVARSTAKADGRELGGEVRLRGPGCMKAGTLPCPGRTAEELKRQRDAAELKKGKEQRRAARVAADAAAAAGPATPAAKPAAPATPIAFLFPGQGSQAVGMLKVRKARGEGRRQGPLTSQLPNTLRACVSGLSRHVP